MLASRQEVLGSLSRSGICLLGVFGTNRWIEWATVSVVQRWGFKRGPLILEKMLLKSYLRRIGAPDVTHSFDER